MVHDIEYGYGDPLRTKCSPEFSIRLMDEAYAAENATIQKVALRSTTRSHPMPVVNLCHRQILGPVEQLRSP